jgi:hypothetical protein
MAPPVNVAPSPPDYPEPQDGRRPGKGDGARSARRGAWSGAAAH